MRFTSFMACLVLLAGCATVYNYAPPKTPGGVMCINECGKAKGFCRQNCDLGESQCMSDEQLDAMTDYNQYVAEQYAAGRPATRPEHDFEHPEDCVPSACYAGCEDRFRMCYVDCGGKITAGD